MKLVFWNRILLNTNQYTWDAQDPPMPILTGSLQKVRVGQLRGPGISPYDPDCGLHFHFQNEECEHMYIIDTEANLRREYMWCSGSWQLKYSGSQ